MDDLDLHLQGHLALLIWQDDLALDLQGNFALLGSRGVVRHLLALLFSCCHFIAIIILRYTEYT